MTVQSGVFGQLARLMEMVDVMLSEMGLHDLSANERAVLLSMSASVTRAEDGYPVCHTEHARAHRLSRQISQPTFHRNLRRLVERGLVMKRNGLGAGEYAIVTPNPEGTEALVRLQDPALLSRDSSA